MKRLPRPRPAITPLQARIVHAGALFLAARESLGRREYEVFLSVVAARVARETAALLDDEARPS